MAEIGKEVKEWEVTEPSVIPEPVPESEPERDEPVQVPEREEEAPVTVRWFAYGKPQKGHSYLG